jgi:sugar phosphate isomerase/epimerase
MSPDPISRGGVLCFPAMTALSLTRRSFLALAGTLPLAPALVHAQGRRPAVGLELFSVRGELAKDLTGTVRTVAKMGYEVVEFFSPYYNWTSDYAREVRRLLDDLGISCPSTHNSAAALTADGLGKAIELNEMLGSRYIVMASPPRITDLDGWKALAGTLTEASERLQPLGMFAGFHNHASEWAPVDGVRPIDVIANGTPKHFTLQLDVGTCVAAGADPVAFINAHPGRITSIHCKDWAPGSPKEEKGYRVLFGEGVSPWPQIFKAAESGGGVEHYLLEQEGSRFSEFETAQRCLDTWREMRG